MTKALDDFELSLVQASRELSAGTEAASDPEPGWGRRVLRRIARSSPVTKGAVGAAVVLACTGGAVATLVPGSSSVKLPELECQIGAHGKAGWPLGEAGWPLTGDPTIDCGGLNTAGRNTTNLAVWGAENGQQMAAIVRPASLGKPAAVGSDTWSRLPASWHLDLHVVALNDQLNSVSLPFNSDVSEICSYGAADVKAVRSLLDADGLASWRVVLHGRRTFGTGSAARTVNGRPYTTGCHVTFPYLTTASDTVELLQSPAMTAHQRLAFNTTPGHSRQAVLVHHERQAYATFRKLDARVNQKLQSSCETVPQATELWKSAARRAGLAPATLRFLRHVDRGGVARLDPKTFFDHYSLYQQPASQHTGSCAHVLAMQVPGSGLFDIYVARIAV